jgi:alkylation response protein AidB-like acyl-CoA dehydrogenase
VPGPFLGHALASLAIAWAGNPQQRARWLPRLATGELLATLCLAEEDAVWQPDEWSLDCGQTLSGIKTFVPHATQAQLLVVGLKGGRFAVIEAAKQIIRCRQANVVDRTRRVHTVEFVDAPALILSESTPTVARRVRDAALVLLAADAFGGASRCVRMAVDYANTREQYGAKIGQFQGLKYQIVDTAIEVEPARGLYWYAAHALSHVPEEAERMSAIAKAHLTEMYLQAARNMIEVHGGIGYTWEFHAHIYLKRAMFDYAFLGIPAAHRRRAVKLADWARLNR